MSATPTQTAALSDAPASLVRAPAGYAKWLAELKTEFRSAQLRASVSVNRELVLLYWRIGRDILERQAKGGWGSKVVDRLAHDLRVEFPEMKGFSPRNLKDMRAFAEAWPEPGFVQQAAAQLPWFHLCTLLDELGDLILSNQGSFLAYGAVLKTSGRFNPSEGNRTKAVMSESRLGIAVKVSSDGDISFYAKGKPSLEF